MNAYGVLMGKPEGRRPLGRLDLCGRIIMDLRKIGWDSTECINLAQGRDKWRALVNMVMNLRAL
jgi:hypothetical protein